MIVRRATEGNWLDTAAVVTPHVAATVKQAGYVGIVRYAPLPGNLTLRDLTGTEVGCILDAGLELLLVQHVRAGHWAAGAHDGERDAEAAVEHASQIGYLPGAHIFQDLEAVTGSAIQVLAYCIDWARTCQRNSYLPGLYVGFDAVLSPDELYALPHTSYWKDVGPRMVSHRGFALKQGQPVTIAGTTFDRDVMAPDLLGETPMILAAQ